MPGTKGCPICRARCFAVNRALMCGMYGWCEASSWLKSAVGSPRLRQRVADLRVQIITQYNTNSSWIPGKCKYVPGHTYCCSTRVALFNILSTSSTRSCDSPRCDFRTILSSRSFFFLLVVKPRAHANPTAAFAETPPIPTP